MANKFLHTILPVGLRSPLKQLRYRWQMRAGRFRSPEPEYDRLEDYCGPGDWVLDIGANVGHYVYRLSDLVGPNGRVFAMEPVPETFALLAGNLLYFPHRNVTLLNLAATDDNGVVHMHIPKYGTASNLYLSRIEPGGEWPVMGYRVDDLRFARRISLVKIDVEGHEAAAIHGMRALLRNDQPVLIVEGHSDAVRSILEEHSYTSQVIGGSPNQIFCPARRPS